MATEYMSGVWKDGIFKDRVIFVTGGAGDICSAQTKAIVHLGANACIIGRNVEKTERVAREIAQVRPGAKVIGIGAVDVRKFEDLKKAADRCASELGAIDFVIAGAAGNFVAPISALTPNGFKSVIDIDTIGTFNTIKATMPHLVASASRNPNPSPTGQTGGRIIYVSATFHYTGVPLQAHVSAAKAGVDSLMASVAIEYGPLGITSNVISPGGIEGTEGMERLSSGEVNKDPKLGAAGVPTGRWGTKRDIGDATVFLFSEAGNYVNGHCLVVDGAAWRGTNAGVGLDPGMRYPDFIISGEFSKNIKSGRKSKL
ncbi:sporulation protein SPS19 [Pyricularia oryzae 70-15]|uniref:2,4-dienoyl-CoA reductase [(3E)-enoyl-CoA-producing] n=4 Tax=Pyricularia TaxID=48558 RepID=Q5EN10_PYRGI|nr:sporulation protein SPS19 [Pyricularia oryzae 70-15]AAX07643.1 sporulation protein-like protein [Pyricularia grisea]ELQ38981.1 peroxisomal 2,4-dienoyl-CoA reductase SPS19 [Pyricularia oryzae Y34]KAI7927674.1 sporulation protein SPS19 [Pyricularia oryzae]EHA52861.1 sporulation protein SPS19 [Pyricularia oryzae 70-15]KAI7930611.1 sporulation protein SPS19 [Pyricularia oryzae]